jgi:hypothetical protein
LKPHGTERLKPQDDESLSIFAFKYNLRLYSMAAALGWVPYSYLPHEEKMGVWKVGPCHTASGE